MVDKKPSPKITFRAFLEGTPPGQPAAIENLWEMISGQYAPRKQLTAPDLFLHCTSEICSGNRMFRYLSGERTVPASHILNTFLTYKCSNCNDRLKVFSIRALIAEELAGTCNKFGEIPSYGPPMPNRLLKIFGDNKELFLKGRRCENQALGIGAFVYYRRIVEGHKDELLSEAIKVSRTLNAPAEKIELLEQAKKEIQFKKSMEMIKDAIPQALLINGHNPFTLLHSALSQGVHNLDDAACLDLAQTVRLVLAELTERLASALKEEKELSGAISRLLNPTK